MFTGLLLVRRRPAGSVDDTLHAGQRLSQTLAGHHIDPGGPRPTHTQTRGGTGTCPRDRRHRRRCRRTRLLLGPRTRRRTGHGDLRRSGTGWLQQPTDRDSGRGDSRALRRRRRPQSNLVTMRAPPSGLSSMSTRPWWRGRMPRGDGESETAAPLGSGPAVEACEPLEDPFAFGAGMPGPPSST
jgi:hypothetical protein